MHQPGIADVSESWPEVEIKAIHQLQIDPDEQIIRKYEACRSGAPEM